MAAKKDSGKKVTVFAENVSQEEKQKALDTAIKQLEKTFGKGAIMKMGERTQMNVESVSTGSIGLDLALGVGGLPRGRIVEIYGPESSGKTTLALHAVAEMQKIGGVAAFIDAEHALDPVYAKALGVDIFLMGSGSIRTEELGPIVTKGDLRTCFPYDDAVHMVYMTGAQLKHALLWMMRDESFLEGAHTEFYQLSKGLLVEYDQAAHSCLRFEFEGEPVEDDRIFTVGLQHYHYLNLPDSFDLTIDDLLANHKDRVISTSVTQIIEETLLAGQHQDAKGYGRMILHLADGTVWGLPEEENK